MRSWPPLVTTVLWIFLVPHTATAQPPEREPVSCDDLDSAVRRALDLRKGGDRRASEAGYRAALGSSLAASCPFQRARAHNGLGTLAVLEMRLFAGIHHLEAAKTALVASAPDSTESRADFDQRAGRLDAKIEHNFASAYLRLGWLSEADDAFRRSRALFRRFGAEAREEARSLLETARLYRFQGRVEEAHDAIREALSRVGDAEATTRAALWQERARLEMESGKLDAAEASLGRAVEALAGKEQGNAYANVIVDHAELELLRERWPESRLWADKTLRLLRQTPDLSLEAHARYVKSVALAKLGDPEGANRVAASGLALLEALRDVWQDLSLDFFALRQSYYRHRLDLARSTEGPEEAWGVFESYWARGLLETASRRGLPADSAALADQTELFQRRKDLLEAVWELDRWDPTTGKAAMEHRAALVRARLLELRKLQAERLLAAGRRPPLPEIEPAAAASMLEAGTLTLTFAGGTRKIHVLALDPAGGLEAITLDVERQQIEVEAAELVTALASGDHPDELALDLGGALLAPLAARLAESRRLVIVAEGHLSRVPFEVLRHPQFRQPLVRSHEIVYLPSLSFLAAWRERAHACPPPKSELLALGDPIFALRDERWPSSATDPRSPDETLALYRLPASDEEVREIAALYRERAVTLALGAEATRARFLAEAPKHRVVHVASHARSDSVVPERSKIALSCVDAAGRVPAMCDLYFRDVAAGNLCGQVVVLSACETAGGRHVSGEGILGLPWAFLHAGAATVVASLWRVPDEPTAELMKTFHRLLRDGTDPAAALRNAKLGLIEAGYPPYVWAAFVLLGDWHSTFSATSGLTHQTRSPQATRDQTEVNHGAQPLPQSR